MKQCPKCGETYSDADLRTICSGCLVDLEQVADVPGIMDQPGPISVGPVSALAPMAMPKMPEITVPGPLMLEPPPPPQTPEVVMPEMPPVEMPFFETPPVAVPPTPLPEPTPEPVAEYLPDASPAMPPRRMTPTAPPVTRPRRHPAAAPQEGSRTLTATVGATLGGNSVATAKARSMTMGILAVILGVVTFFAFTGIATATRGGGFFALLFFAALLVATIAAARAAIYQGMVDTVLIAPQGEALLGAVLPIAVTIDVLRDLPVTGIQLTVTAQEVAKKKDGDNTTTYRHTIFTHTAQLTVPTQWPGGHVVTLDAHIPIPAEAMPSFAGSQNAIEWAAALWVTIPGLHPDIRKNLPLTVRPLRPDAPPAVTRPHTFDVPALQGLYARATLDCAVTPEGTPVLPMGKPVAVILSVTPETTARRPLRVELAYHVSGTGTHEDRTVAGVTGFNGGWQAGTTCEDRTELTIPISAPLSYEGRHLRVRWTLTISEDSYSASAPRQIMPVVVVPGVAE